jgi:hypothetical protein
MLKDASKYRAERFLAPIGGGLRDQKMKQRIVCGGDCPAELDLEMVRRVEVRKSLGQLKQVVGASHD